MESAEVALRSDIHVESSYSLKQRSKRAKTAFKTDERAHYRKREFVRGKQVISLCPALSGQKWMDSFVSEDKD